MYGISSNICFHLLGEFLKGLTKSAWTKNGIKLMSTSLKGLWYNILLKILNYIDNTVWDRLFALVSDSVWYCSYKDYYRHNFFLEHKKTSRITFLYSINGNIHLHLLDFLDDLSGDGLDVQYYDFFSLILEHTYLRAIRS